MKNFHKALSILAAAALFAGCSSYDETNDPARAGNTSVTVSYTHLTLPTT